MVKKKKSFIDKKHAQKFSLVHRSQHDPLIADETAGEHVLIPQAGSSATAEDPKLYGIEYDDDEEYDYMQHLRERGGGELILAEYPSESSGKTGGLVLPAEALPSAYEEEEGMLSLGVLPRGPQPDWDPDIVEALDDGLDMDDPDNILSDDFIMKANSSKTKAGMEGDDDNDDDDDEGGWETDDGDSDAFSEYSGVDSDFDINSDDLASDDDTKTQFTNYSMTSSVIRRTEELKLLDSRFERLMEEYDESKMGCIEEEELEGILRTDTDVVEQALQEFEASQMRAKIPETEADADECMEEDQTSEEEDDDKLFAQFEKAEKPEWDCESVISTYSNLYNHPKIISNEPSNKTKKNLAKPIEIGAKTGLPLGILQKRKEDTEEEMDDENQKMVVMNNNRNKNETTEERKARKQAVKLQRKERRVDKKQNKLAFKSEELKQEKVIENKKNQQTLKL